MTDSLFALQTPGAGVTPVAPAPGQDTAGVVSAPEATPAVHRPVIGLDLSLRATGLAWTVNTVAPVQSKLITAPTGWTGVQRLRAIRARILDHIGRGALVLIEGPAYRQGADPGAHERAGLWWLIVEALDAREHQVLVVSPSTVKKYATGKGNAGKDLVLTQAVRRLPDFDGDNNQADAAWLAAIGADILTAGQVRHVPATHAAALAAIPWGDR